MSVKTDKKIFRSQNPEDFLEIRGTKRHNELSVTKQFQREREVKMNIIS